MEVAILQLPELPDEWEQCRIPVDVLRHHSPVAAVEFLDHRVEGADPVEADVRLVDSAVLSDAMEAAVRFKKPLIGDSFVCGDAAALSQIGGKPQCGVLAGRSAAVGAGEGMSAVVDSGQDAHLLPGQPTLHLLDDCSKAGITSAADALAARIHIRLIQFNLSEEDFIIQNLLKDAHQAMAHV